MTRQIDFVLADPTLKCIKLASRGFPDFWSVGIFAVAGDLANGKNVHLNNEEADALFAIVHIFSKVALFSESELQDFFVMFHEDCRRYASNPERLVDKIYELLIYFILRDKLGDSATLGSPNAHFEPDGRVTLTFITGEAQLDIECKNQREKASLRQLHIGIFRKIRDVKLQQSKRNRPQASLVVFIDLPPSLLLHDFYAVLAAVWEKERATESPLSEAQIIYTSLLESSTAQKIELGTYSVGHPFPIQPHICEQPVYVSPALAVFHDFLWSQGTRRTRESWFSEVAIQLTDWKDHAARGNSV